MAGFSRTYRQRVIDEYLNSTGLNMFHPREFLAWLETMPDHAVYPVFFGKTDEEAATEYRLSLARQFVSGLRIKITVTPAMASSSPHIAVMVHEPTVLRVPAYVSPVNNRRSGGGYVATDLDDAEAMREMYRQAAQALASWLERHGDVARLAGADVDSVRSTLGLLTVAGSADADADEAA